MKINYKKIQINVTTSKIECNEHLRGVYSDLYTSGFLRRYRRFCKQIKHKQNFRAEFNFVLKKAIKGINTTKGALCCMASDNYMVRLQLVIPNTITIRGYRPYFIIPVSDTYGSPAFLYSNIKNSDFHNAYVTLCKLNALDKGYFECDFHNALRASVKGDEVDYKSLITYYKDNNNVNFLLKLPE